MIRKLGAPFYSDIYTFQLCLSLTSSSISGLVDGLVVAQDRLDCTAGKPLKDDIFDAEELP